MEVLLVYVYSLDSSSIFMLAARAVGTRALSTRLGLMLPFRIVGITMNGLFAFLSALIMLPERILHGPGAK